METTVAERTILELLEQQLRQVRGWTWKCIGGTSEGWLYRRVDWTDNTIGWHMGHLSWELDVFTEICFDADRELDAEWDRLFAAGCGIFESGEYPPADRLTAVFHRSMRRYLEHLGQIEEDDALIQQLQPHPASPNLRWTLLNAVVNLVFHEGEHAAGIGTLAAYFERAEDAE
jgi:hypothetical protein